MRIPARCKSGTGSLEDGLSSFLATFQGGARLHDSVVVELDLAGRDDELAVLSGGAETTAVADEIMAEVGSDPAAWLPLFHKRRRLS
jgi:type IV secretory pathway VirB4 component